MSDTQHIPTLSTIVDMIVTRKEHVDTHGNPDEARMLAEVVDIIAAYAQREERLARLVRQATPEDAA